MPTKTPTKNLLVSLKFKLEDLTIVGLPKPADESGDTFDYYWVIYCSGMAEQHLATDELMNEIVKITKSANNNELPGAPPGNRQMITLESGQDIWIPVIPDSVIGAKPERKGRQPKLQAKGIKFNNAGPTYLLPRDMLENPRQVNLLGRSDAVAADLARRLPQDYGEVLEIQKVTRPAAKRQAVHKAPPPPADRYARVPNRKPTAPGGYAATALLDVEEEVEMSDYDDDEEELPPPPPPKRQRPAAPLVPPPAAIHHDPLPPAAGGHGNVSAIVSFVRMLASLPHGAIPDYIQSMAVNLLNQ